jgi:hypothetical protein
MKFKVKLGDGQTLVVDRNIWLGGVKLRIGKTPIGPWNARTKEPIAIELKDGSQKKLTLKIGYFDPAPRVFLDNIEIEHARKLEKWETAIVCLPILLAAFMGAIPVLVGFGGVYINYGLIRNNDMSPVLRWSLIGINPIIGASLLLMIGLAMNPHPVAKENPWTARDRPASDVEQSLR